MNVLMPQLGETVAEGTVSAWHKDVGDRVEADEILLDVETDKVSMEIPAPSAGRIKQILIAAGQTVEVGTVLAIIESGEGAADTQEHGDGNRASSDGAAGANPPAAAPATEPAHATGDDTRAASAANPTPGGNGSPGAAQRPLRREAASQLSPVVRRLLSEHGLAAAEITGTGRNGRLTRRDVLARLERSEPSTASTATNGASAAAAASTAARGKDAVREPFNRVRRLTAEHMVRSKATSPHVLQAVEVDFSAVERVRREVRESWRARHGYSLTFLPFVAHAVCRALGDFPQVNASVDGDALWLHPHVNLAIAVDLGPGGLVAPVIRSAETLALPALAAAMRDVADRARAQQLVPDDFAGGTYTLSNSGTFGTLITAPIINQPQVAILSIDGVRKRAVVIEDENGDTIGIRPVGVLAQSFDHRAFDGAYSAAFLARVRELLEGTNWSAAL